MKRLLLISLLAYATQALSLPQGFSGPAPKRQMPLGFDQLTEPNTIKGVLNNARDKDFVLLQGSFVKKLNITDYTFEDEAGDSIVIHIGNTNIVPLVDAKYMIWCVVDKGLFQTRLIVDLISAPFK